VKLFEGLFFWDCLNKPPETCSGAQMNRRGMLPN
jgi:hypothetical protein